MKKIKFLRPEVVELIQDAFDALIERDYENLCESEGYRAGAKLERDVKKAEGAILALQMTMDTADICEEAHKRTVRECKKRNIKVDCTSVRSCKDDAQEHGKDADGTHYTARAQDVFNRHFDEVEAWAEEHKIRVNN